MSLEKMDALEERITKVVEMVKGLKEEKVRLEGEVALLKDELAKKTTVEEEAARLRQEKEQVKERLERILKGIEELS